MNMTTNVNAKEISENIVARLLKNCCRDDIPGQLDRQTVIGFSAYMLRLGIEAGQQYQQEQNRIHQRSGAWNRSDDMQNDYYIAPLADR